MRVDKRFAGMLFCIVSDGSLKTSFSLIREYFLTKTLMSNVCTSVYLKLNIEDKALV